MGAIDEEIFLAKISEQAERYDVMVSHMKTYVTSEPNLGLEERNLLSVAYKNVVGARRASLRVIMSIEEKEKSSNSPPERLQDVSAYVSKVEGELNTICEDILALLDSKLIPTAEANSKMYESVVFYKKMKADYYRYQAEFKKSADKMTIGKKAQSSYEDATNIATKNLAPTHPIRLGLALNYSVFLYEVQQEEGKACTLAKTAFDDAIAELDTLDEESYKDSTLIMQLLRDNLTLWSGDDQ